MLGAGVVLPRRASARAVAGIAATACAWFAWAPASAHATIACAQDEFGQPHVQISGHSERARVYADGVGRIMLDPVRAGTVDPGPPAPCGTATVTNTQTLTVRGRRDSSQAVEFDLGEGPFTPGFGDEPGSSDEIEIVLDLGGGRGVVPDSMRVSAGFGADRIHLGTTGVNLNANEANGIDADIVYRGPRPGVIVVLGRAGGDWLDPRGGRGSGSQTITSWLNIDGGAGVDLVYGTSRTGGSRALCGVPSIIVELIAFERRRECIRGGSGNDHVSGSGGTDHIDGNDGNDSLHGGAGRDLIWGGDGNDWLYGGSAADRLGGGRHFDRCRGDSGDDSFSDCERLE